MTVTQIEREKMMSKIEELQTRVEALSSAAGLIAGELQQLQIDFWKRTAKQEG